MGLTQKTTIIKQDSKGYYIVVSGKKIRFSGYYGDYLNTPINISKTKYIGDYRAFGGVKKGKRITLAIYDK